MGNSIGGIIIRRKKTVKIMKMNGETMKLKVPIQAEDVVKDYPGHVLLDSEAVKHYGIRAKPIDTQQQLEPRRLYFLVELPQLQVPRRVRSSAGIHMSAKDRLDSLMLARRSASDLFIIKPMAKSESEEEDIHRDGGGHSHGHGHGGAVRVRMKLPKSEVTRLMNESKDEAEVVGKIVDLCVAKSSSSSSPSSTSTSSSSAACGGGSCSLSTSRSSSMSSLRGKEVAVLPHHQQAGHLVRHRHSHKKKVGFLPVTQGEIQPAAAS
ncbi:hypothetical protein Dimus_031080 [Dionaea muscipula]